MGNLLALSIDNVPYRFRLEQGVSEQVHNLFIDAARLLKPDDAEEIQFDGNYMLRQNEHEIFVVDYTLDQVLVNAVNNMAATPAWDGTTFLKALIWVDEGNYYFQAFTKKNILTHRFVLSQSRDTYNRVNTNTLIIDENVHAIFYDNKLYFANYSYANRIFSLSNYVIEATNEKIEEFSHTAGIRFKLDWMKRWANSKTRRLIQSVSGAGTVPLFIGMGPRKRKSLLREFNVQAEIVNDEIQFPTNIAAVNKILEFLDEDVYKGIISGKTHHSNSKRTD